VLDIELSKYRSGAGLDDASLLVSNPGKAGSSSLRREPTKGMEPAI